MERFGSFNADHKKLRTGVYLSRVDAYGNDGAIYTIDVRTRRPYKDKVLTDVLAHSVEHIGACQLEDVMKNGQIKKVYWGVMGCMTGYYFLCYVPKELYSCGDKLVLNYLHLAFDTYCPEVPFNSETLCGNCRTLANTAKEILEVNDELAVIDSLVMKCLSQGHFDDYPQIAE